MSIAITKELQDAYNGFRESWDCAKTTGRIDDIEEFLADLSYFETAWATFCSGLLHEDIELCENALENDYIDYTKVCDSTDEQNEEENE